ncbi:hypothetical protein AB1Y20_015356 [Prymnesium parvum]|uniref:TFIID subunit TAF5 NTD2 domain-containing protein n=1 Tax=Prymnesium parvum TaxID=97485 RepID=A0AB34K0N3_PRYPA
MCVMSDKGRAPDRRPAHAAAAPSEGALDELVLHHLRSRGYMQSASALERELQLAPSAAAAPFAVEGTRPALSKLLITAAAPAIAQNYGELRDWVETCLDAYKPELRRVLFPLFVGCYLSIVRSSEREVASHFFNQFREDHALAHRAELNALSQLTSAEQLDASPIARRVESDRWEVPISAYAHALLLHAVHSRGLAPLLHTLNQRVRLVRHRAHPDPSVDDGQAGSGTAAAAAAHLWLGISDAAIEEANQSEQAWGPLEMLEVVHKRFSAARADDAAAEDAAEEEAVGGEEGRGEKQRGKKRKPAAAAPEAGGSLVSNAASRVPLPPVDERVEKEIVKESRRCVSLVGRKPPTAAFVTVLDAAGMLCSAVFSSDSTILACGFSDSQVRLYLLKEAGPPKKKKAQPPKEAPAEPPAEGAAEGAPDATAVVEGTTSMEGEATSVAATVCLRGHAGPVYSLSFSRDDTILLSCSQDGTVRLWGIAQRACLVCYQAHAAPVWGVAFAPLGSYFATASHDRTVRVWCVNSLQPLRLLVGHLADVRCCCFHPNLSLLASGSDDLSIRIWDVQDAKCVRILCKDGHSAAVTCVAISNDGQLLASGGSDKAVLVWRLSSGCLLRRLRVHTGTVWSVGFSQESAQLVSGSADCSIAVWDVVGAMSSEETPHELQADTAQAPDGVAKETPYLISRLYTKETPVLASRFTRTNLVLAAGAFSPRKK